MAAHSSFRVTVAEGFDLPPAGGMRLGGSGNIYVVLRVDDKKVAKSEALAPDSSGTAVVWNFSTEVHSGPSARQLLVSVKRTGVLGFTSHIGGCCLQLQDLQQTDDAIVEIWDDNRVSVGKLRISIQPLGGAAALPPTISAAPRPSLPGGLVNRSSTGCGGEAFSLGGAGAAAGAGAFAQGGLVMQLASGGSSGSGGSALPGGLVNRASTGGGGGGGGGGAGFGGRLSNYSDAARLSNYSEVAPSMSLASASSAGAPCGTALSGGLLNRGGTGQLENLAAERGDGTRANALQQALEILRGLAAFDPADAEQRQRLRRALEELRRAPAEELRGAQGIAASAECAERIRAIFAWALRSRDEREANGALWLAGRLPVSEEASAVTLQDELRRQWDAHKMREALQVAAGLGDRACTGNLAALEEVMDALDLAEFHAQLAAVPDGRREVARILDGMKEHLRTYLERQLAAGASLDELENILSVLGSVRVDIMGLRPVQEQVQLRRGLDLLRTVLLPLPGQIGFPQLREPQRRHAVMTMRTVLAAGDAKSGAAASALRAVLLRELLPQLPSQNPECAVVAVQTALELRMDAAEVWAALKAPFHALQGAAASDFARLLLARCREWGRDPPHWLVSPEQAAARAALQRALGETDATAIQTACRQVMGVDGGQDVCQEEMRLAVDILREQYRLPEGWDVGSMLAPGSDSRLLAKNPIEDPALLEALGKILQDSANPRWTRDRRGRVPQRFTAARAVQVMNGPSWASYVRRRDAIADDCRRAGVRHDRDYWDRQLNGSIQLSLDAAAVAERAGAPPLCGDANEFWLLHGTSHAAAEGITSDDFDMTRANPSGLFGAGLYFAESVSKSDEYVEGKADGGKELFPLLLCRVCLGDVFYCAERRPDRRQLEDRCLAGKWHSVLGDRKVTSGTFREFIVYDNVQAFPAYIIFYERHY